MTTAESTLTRREPKQQRSRRTVDDVLEAVQLVVKRHGTQAITTNRIAEAAGVSVGSLYQYFPTSAQSSRPFMTDTSTMYGRSSSRRRPPAPRLRWKNSRANSSKVWRTCTRTPRNCTRLFRPPFRRALSASRARCSTRSGGCCHPPIRIDTASTRRSECFLSFHAWWNRSFTERPTRRMPPSRVMAPGARRSAPYWST